MPPQLWSQVWTAYESIQASDVPTWHMMPSLQGEDVSGDVLLRKGTKVPTIKKKDPFPRSLS